jgi:branched-chain amino acid transport system permease protein
MAKPSPRTLAAVAILVILALVPLLTALFEQPFYLTIVARIMIFGLAALGLNLILGYGGMVSFGHAMYLGIGAYAVAILTFHGIGNGWAHLAVALAIGVTAALLVGSVCLRTSGMAFIMITLAFAQMFFFLAVGLKQYGGDDGLAIPSRSAFGLVDLGNATILYYAIYLILLATLYGAWHLIHSRFGMVLRGCKSNERRMISLGVPTLRYKLTAYVISAQVCVIAGMLLANLTRFCSPAYMQWQVSGELIVMAVLGGAGTLLGPVAGAATLLVIEALLTSLNLGLPWGIDEFIRDHWMAPLGLFIVLVVLTLRQGIYGHLAATPSSSP